MTRPHPPSDPSAESDAAHPDRTPEPEAETAVPTIADIHAAAERIAGAVIETPLLPSEAISARLGARVLVKAEPLQHTGSFKMRGAMNRLARLTSTQRAAGVLAYSSGNHAQAVARAARLVGTSAVIVMPADAPALKIERTRGHGAEVILYDRQRESREAIGHALAAERGLTVVPPYDDPDVIAGQGTLALEMARQARALGAGLDTVIVCCSGGGLAAGCALALEAESPGTALYVAEPAGYDDTARSLAAGRRVAITPAVASVCDALLVPMPGALTFAINAPRLAGALSVSDEAALTAVAYAARELKLIVEPGGAVALAAALSGQLDLRDQTVGLILTGGNIAAPMLARALNTA